jgi:hypothetical protein
MFPVRYEQVFHIPEDGILHSHRRETSDVTYVTDFHETVYKNLFSCSHCTIFYLQLLACGERNNEARQTLASCGQEANKLSGP